MASVLAACSCSPLATDTKTADGRIAIRGGGATFPNPLYQRWLMLYNAAQRSVEVSYKSVGSGKGIEGFLEDTVDFGASDRAMAEDQVAQTPRGVLVVPTCAGMVTLAYNPEGLPATLRLPRDVYVDIFLGKIKHWNDPRIQAAHPDFKFPAKPITVVVRQDKSGTTFAFTYHLAAVSPEWKAGPGVGQTVQWTGAPVRAPGNEGVVAMIQRNPYSLGYAEYGQANRLGLRMAELQNKAKKFVAPAGKTGLGALLQAKMPGNFRLFLPDPEGYDAYPIITYTWILAHRQYADPKKAQAMREFLAWCLTQGQDDCDALGYVRLPPEVVDRVLEEVRKIR